MRISDWSSDVCSSDLPGTTPQEIAPRKSDFSVRADEDRALTQRIGKCRAPTRHPSGRSEERRVGKECVSTCRSRWSPYHSKNNNPTNPSPLPSCQPRHTLYTITIFYLSM